MPVMAPIRVSTVIEAAPFLVWAHVERVEDHVTWMRDATEIRFLGEQRSGVGTRFECDTKVGPIRLTDVMEITEWESGAVMGVRHSGVVTGVGRFTLAPAGPDRTEFRWEEDLSFPWWLGGRFGEIVGARVLAVIWRGNLKRLKAEIERA